MPVKRPELPGHINDLSYVISIYVNQPLGYHQWNVVQIIAQAVHCHIHHIKSLSVHFVTEPEIGYNLSHN